MNLFGKNNLRQNAGKWISSIVFGVLNIAALLLFVWTLKTGFSPMVTQAATGIYKALNFRGTLQNNDGTSVANGAYNLQFTIYDSASGGTCLYTARGTCGTPTAKSITVTSGVFTTMIGDTDNGDNAITIDFNSTTYWLGVTVGADAELTPRVRIGASGYAFNADLLDGLNTSSNGGTTSFVPVTNSFGNLNLTGDPRGTSAAGSSLYINPSTATSTFALLGLSVGDAEKFRVDASGNIFASGTIYSSGTGTSTIKGNTELEGNVALGNSSSDNIQFQGSVSSNILPSINNIYDLGASATSWKDIYASGTIYAGTDVLVNGQSVCLENGTNCASIPEAAGWTHSGADVYLQASTDRVTVGTSTSPLAKLNVYGDTDEVQFLVQGNGTQTRNLTEWRNSADSILAYISPAGNFGVSGTIYASISTSTLDGVTIGQSTAATGTFTGLTANQTSNFNGIVNIGDGGDAVVINSNIWDISSSGIITGIGSITPGTNNNSDLGSYANSWKDIYASGTVRVATDVVVNGQSVCLENGMNCLPPGWTDGGAEVYLTTAADDVVIGTSTINMGKLAVIGTANKRQLVIKANTTQTASLTEWLGADNSLAAWVSPAGNIGASGSIMSSSSLVVESNDTYVPRLILSSATTTVWRQIGGDDVKGSWAGGGYNYSMMDFNGKLYVSFTSGNNFDGEIWVYDGTFADIASSTIDNNAGRWSKIGGDSINGSWTAGDSYQMVNSIESYNGEIYVVLGGVLGQPCSEVWAYNGVSWRQVGGDSLNGSWSSTQIYGAYSLKVLGDKLYASIGGGTHAAGDTADAAVWEYNGTTWRKIAGDSVNGSWPNDTQAVAILEVLNGRLYAGLGGIPGEDGSADVWVWNGNSWTLVGGGDNSVNNSWATDTYEGVKSISAYNGRLYVGINNLGVGNPPEVWEFNETSWKKVGGADSSAWDNDYTKISSLIPFSGKLVAAGQASPDRVWEYNGYTWKSIGGNGENGSWDRFHDLDSVATYGNRLIVAAGGNIFEYNESAGTIAKYDNGMLINNILTIDDHGYVGINNVNPKATLDVKGELILNDRQIFTSSTLGRIGFGTTTPGARLHIFGDNDTKQLIIQGNATQTNNLTEWQDGASEILAWINASGNFGTSGTIYASGNATSTFLYNATFATAGGKVGIGTDIASSTLTVVRTSGGIAEFGNGSATTTVYGNNIMVNGQSVCLANGLNCASIPAAAGWVGTDSEIYLQTSTNNVTVGVLGSLGKLTVLGDADEKQFVIKANATQTNNIFEIQNSVGDIISYISPAGNFGVSGTIYGSIATSTWYGSITTSTFYGSITTSTFYGSITTSTFDGVTIGKSTAASGTFTGLTVNQTANFNGITNIGDGGDAIAINSNVWDITSAGTITGIGSITPGTNNNSDLGSYANSWKDIYASGTVRVGTDVVVNGQSVCLANGTNCSAVPVAAGWSDGGAEIYLSTSGDNVTIGGSGSLGKLTVLGDTDEKQLVIKANATQTNNIFEIQNSSNEILTWMDSSGNFGTSGTIYGSIATSTWYGSIATSTWYGNIATSTFYGSIATSTWYANIATSTFDGVTIGGSTAATGTFTGLTVNQTASFNGIINIGDGGDAVVINSNVWDITSAGIITGIGSITPATNNNSDLASSAKSWRDIYASGTIYVGTDVIVNGQSVCLENGMNCSAVASGWTQDTAEIYLTVSTDNVTVGTSTSPLAKLSVIGDTNEKQFVIRANATQTANITEWLGADNGLLAWVSPVGNIGASGSIMSSSSLVVDTNGTYVPSLLLRSATTTAWRKIGGDSVKGSWASESLVNFETSYNGKMYVGLGGTVQQDAEVWMYDDMSTSTPWTEIGGDSLNGSWSSSAYNFVRSGEIYNGKLYVGTGYIDGDADVWAFNGTSWTKIGGSGLNDSWAAGGYSQVVSMKAAGGYLYASLGVQAGDGEVWRFDGTKWVQIGGDNINGSWANEEASQLEWVNGKLYAGLEGGYDLLTNSTEIWEYNGVYWTQIGGDSLNGSWANSIYVGVHALKEFNGHLFAGLWGISAGLADVYEYNGTSWSQVGGDGIKNSWAASSYKVVYDFVAYNGRLFASLGNGTGDAEVYEYNGGSWTKIGGDGLNSSWSAGVYETAYAMVVHNNRLITGLGNTSGDGEVWELQESAGSIDRYNDRMVVNNLLTIDDHGYVGVNNLNPEAALDVKGEFVLNDKQIFTSSSLGRIGFGTTTPQSKLHIFGETDVKQLIIQGNATQTKNITEWQNGASTILAWINNSGNFGTSGTITATGAIFASSTLAISGNTSSTNIYPWTNNQYDLGSATTSWKNIYASSTIYGGNFYSTASTSTFTYGSTFATTGGNVGIGTANPTDLLTLFKTVNPFLSVGNGAGTTTITGGLAGFATSTFSGDLVVPNLYSGMLEFNEDGGIVPAMNIPVTAAATGTIEAYTFDVDGLTTLSVGGRSDGLSSIWNRFVGVNTSTPYGTEAFSVNGTITVGSYGTNLGGTSTFYGNIAATGTITANCSGTCLDIAEQYESLDSVEAGDVVVSAGADILNSVVNPYNASLVKKSSTGYAAAVVGIVSTNPGLALTMDNTVQMAGGGSGSANKPNIALAGRVPVKVTDENGEIKKGDLLVTSPTEPGHAMKFAASSSTPAGLVNVFAMALEDWNPATASSSLENTNIKTNKVTVLIRNAYVSVGGSENFGSELTMDAGSSIIDPLMPAQDTFDMAGKDLINIGSLAGVENKWSIDENGNFAISGEIVKKIETSQGEKDFYPVYNEDPTIMLSGSGELINGEARIIFAPALSEIMDPADPIKVNVTMTSEGAQGLYVAEKSIGDILVREINGGKGGARFDYMIIAKRKMNGALAETSGAASSTPETDSAEQSAPTDNSSSTSTPDIAPPVVTPTSTLENAIVENTTPTSTPENSNAAPTSTPTIVPIAGETSTSTGSDISSASSTMEISAE